MFLERTLHMLQTQTTTEERARELAQMGFMQWLGSLNGRAGFAVQAKQALQAAGKFRATDPAVELFCQLVEEALEVPPKPLSLALPKKCRRGGARKRRQMI